MDLLKRVPEGTSDQVLGIETSDGRKNQSSQNIVELRKTFGNENVSIPTIDGKGKSNRAAHLSQAHDVKRVCRSFQDRFHLQKPSEIHPPNRNEKRGRKTSPPPHMRLAMTKIA